MEEFEKSFTLNMDAQQSEMHVSPKGMDMLIENGGFDFGQKNQEFLLLHEELYKNQSYSEESDSPDHNLVAYIKENEEGMGPNGNLEKNPTTEENSPVPVPRGLTSSPGGGKPNWNFIEEELGISMSANASSKRGVPVILQRLILQNRIREHYKSCTEDILTS